MTMPGFTAEASLGRPSEHFSTTTGWADAPFGEVIIPQQVDFVPPRCDCFCVLPGRLCIHCCGGFHWSNCTLVPRCPPSS